MRSASLRFSVLKRPDFLFDAVLSLFWALGLLSGCLLGLELSANSLSLMRMLVSVRMSIIGLILLPFFPLVLSVVILWLSKPLLLLPMVFLKSLFYGFTACGIMVAFGDAGWLLRWLILFSDTLVNVFLLWLWFRGVSEKGSELNKNVTACALLSALVLFIDYYSVSPFVQMLFDH